MPAKTKPCCALVSDGQLMIALIGYIVVVLIRALGRVYPQLFAGNVTVMVVSILSTKTKKWIRLSNLLNCCCVERPQKHKLWNLIKLN